MTENHREDLLRILECHGGPGFEQDVARTIEQAFMRYTSQIHRDALGNLAAVVAGSGEGERPRILLAAHMDEIALVVTKIEPGGFLRVWQAGGFDARTLMGQEVWVHGKRPLLGIIGSKPPHLTTVQERKQAPPLEDLYIDLAMPESSVRQLVRVGDRVTLSRESLSLLHNRIAGKALDNRASVAVLLETLRFLRSLRHHVDVYAVATVQEEVGVRGATTAAYGMRPDIGIAIDVTFADFPGQAPDDSFKMGKGPAIAFGPNIHPKVFARMRDVAETHQIPYQLELSQGPTGTDARAIQITREGIATGLVGVAIRYMHTSVETVDYQDIVECGRLLAHFIASIDTTYVEGLSCY
ncbi:M42 family metallopeptidase [Alicyclobacillus herbarius]|uniref:M42 family metallopeptidase n=1 Tax=Alicyclobacillus herbarius TaxID=122960 RepID=UPI00235600C0|nr:M42 family metallopeptidase [Alicyclobacillus herbarius]